jgi:D-aminopeptidase
MTCFGLKGGIGSASRLAHMSNDSRMIAALVLANFGKPLDLTLDGVRLGPWLNDWLTSAQPGQDPSAVPEKGSIIMLLATDAPLNCNQLRRLARRAGAGLARTGAYYGHGSGDIAIAVSTAAKKNAPIGDAALDPLFRAAADATEGAIVDALLCATPVKGFRDHYFYDLSYLLDQLAAEFIS